MSTLMQAEILDGGAAPIGGERSRWARASRPVEDWLIALADRANPILVKETRQALKSRQFVITFLVVLLKCWFVSFVAIAFVGPEIYWSASGPIFLICYVAVLAIPLAMIVPFSAFRSLAAEQEEQTFELLYITTLSSSKIITGKLATAAVQMIVYLCAVSPCIAFTFLLRGVDAITIGILLAGIVLGSMGLSMVALLIGAMARARGSQVLTSVIVIIGLALACIGGVALSWTIIQAGSGFMREEGFWIAMSVLITFYLTFFGLFHSAAAAQIGFKSENRSTPLRRWMMVQQACFCGWFGFAIYWEVASSSGIRASQIGEIIVAAMLLATVYWSVMGALLTGEWPILSRRVQRSLPQSTLARTTLSLFNPGPGTGYLFAVANLTTIVLIGLVMLLFRGSSTGRFTATETIACFLVLSWSYVVGYLGLGRLLIVLLRRWIFVPLTAAFLLQVVLLMAGTFTPLVIQMTSRQLRNQGYTLLQLTNPFWTLEELMDHGPSAVHAEVLIWIVPAAAVATLILNMRSVATELMHHRVAAPLRVLEEEAALHAPVVKPSNPWEIEEELE